MFTSGPNLVGLGLNKQPFPRPVDIQPTALNAVDDICESLDEGRETRCTMEDGRAALEIAMAIRESHRRGGARVQMPFGDLDARIKSP